MRKWGGFVVRRDPPRRLIAGVLFDQMFGLSSEAAYFHLAPPIGRAVLLVPQGNGRVRAYLIYPHDARHRLQGTDDVSKFIDESVGVGVPGPSFSRGRPSPVLSPHLTVQIIGLSIPTATESRSSETRPRRMTHASVKDYRSPFVM